MPAAVCSGYTRTTYVKVSLLPRQYMLGHQSHVWEESYLEAGYDDFQDVKLLIKLLHYLQPT